MFVYVYMLRWIYREQSFTNQRPRLFSVTSGFHSQPERFWTESPLSSKAFKTSRLSTNVFLDVSFIILFVSFKISQRSRQNLITARFQYDPLTPWRYALTLVSVSFKSRSLPFAIVKWRELWRTLHYDVRYHIQLVVIPSKLIACQLFYKLCEKCTPNN